MAAIVGALILAAANLIPVLGDIILYAFVCSAPAPPSSPSSPGAARGTYSSLRPTPEIGATCERCTGGGSPASSGERVLGLVRSVWRTDQVWCLARYA